MLNVTALAGKIVSLPKKHGEYDFTMEISVQRNFQNSDGDYESDLFEIVLWKGLGEEISQYCKINDYVVLRGRIEKQHSKMLIIAESMNFIR